MVNTTIARPLGILQDYIQAFELRVFDTHGELLKKPLHAYHEVLISFIIDSEKPLFEPSSNNASSYLCDPSNPPYSGLMGIQTSMKGSFVFKGSYKIFNIQFKPIGFSSIFQLPVSMLNDQFFDPEEVIYNEFRELHEQLYEQVTFDEMVLLATNFLERKLARNRFLCKNDSIRKVANFIIKEPTAYTIAQLAYHSNMTLKTFERKFVQLVGIRPKLYARIRRFNQALELKQYHEKLTWLDICEKTGYFDLMHLNKEFKAFAGNPPTSFFKNSPPIYENQVIP